MPAAWRGGQPLRPGHVWLMLAPQGASPACCVHRGVWRVVCLAALAAMDKGRAAANGWALEQRRAAEQAAAAQQPQPSQPRGPGRQQRIDEVLQPAPPTAHQQQHNAQVQQRRQVAQQQAAQQLQQQAAARLEEVKRAAVARFWELLQDFVVVQAAPAAWLPCIAPDHPFLCIDGSVEGVQVLVTAVHPG